MPLAFLPSPVRAAWHLGPLPLRAQGLCCAAGIIVALVITARRHRAAGGAPGVVSELAAWALPAGLIPAALGLALARVHPGPLQGVRSWDELAGFPAAVAFGLAGTWAGCRRLQRRRSRGRLGPGRAGPGARGSARGLLAAVAGAAAPGLLAGHALSMAGSWAAQGGYGMPSALWWAVEIDPAHRAAGLENFATFQPLFGYRALSDVVLALAITWAARRWALSGDLVLAGAATGYAASGFAMVWLGIGHTPAVLGLRATALGDLLLLIVSVTYLMRMRYRRGTAPHGSGKVAMERSRPVM